MEKQSADDLRQLLARAGLNPTKQDFEKLKPLYEQNRERLKLLHVADLGQDLIAGVFSPKPKSKPRR
jgi:hypothetical protein